MNKRGFTLIEVIIVIALLGILMAMATPSLVAWRENAQNKEVAREILAGMRQARSLAVTEACNVSYSIDPETRSIEINTGDRILTRQLPGTSDIEVWARQNESAVWDNHDGSDVISFAPQGNASNLVRVRVNNEIRLTVEINSAASGLARIN